MGRPPNSILLDKGVVRCVYQVQVRRASLTPLTPSQLEAIRVFARLRFRAKRIYITRESANVLTLRPQQNASLILNRTEVLRKGRYLRRWARQLCSFGFSPEDAVVIAYASFGLDSRSQLANVEALVTNNFKLVNNFKTQQTNIEDRFKRMVSNLLNPYSSLELPEVMTTADALASI